jgi:preprotein translocase subunit SecD
MQFSLWRSFLIFALSALICMIAIPNLLPQQTFNALPNALKRKMVLGLDLQGGSQLLLQVDADFVRKERVENLRDEVRRVLRDGKIGYTNLAIQPGLTVQVRIREEKDVPDALRRLRELAQPLGGVFAGSNIQDIEIADQGGGLIRLTITNAGITQRIGQSVEQSIEIVRKRVDELGTVEPSIQRQGLDRILVQVPGLDNPKRLIDLIGQTAKLSFRMVDQTTSPEQAATRPPPDSELLLSNDNPPVPYVIERRVVVSGEDLVDAQPSTDQRTGEWVVSFRFNSAGARRFGIATRDNVGRPFAIVLDNRVISAPVIREPILGGSGQISGNFTAQSANDLAILLRAGALPAPLTVIEERTVGPGLGQDSINAGITAAWIGSLFVVLFMIATYGLFGIIANIAVAVNVGMILGILSLLGATLTLPGIAGIVLTVGIAVDSNVLIYERIREEVRAGRSAISALNAGFDRALATILDSNLTTLIAAAVLFYVGTGPVRGFAVTFGIGILTTLFTAFTFTRLLVAVWYRWWRPKTLPI